VTSLETTGPAPLHVVPASPAPLKLASPPFANLYRYFCLIDPFTPGASFSYNNDNL
jgi:hypothetical protein